MKEKVFCGSVETVLLKHISDLKKENGVLSKKIDRYERYILESCEGERCAHCGVVVDGNSIVRARGGYESYPCCSRECAMGLEPELEDNFEAEIEEELKEFGKIL